MPRQNISSKKAGKEKAVVKNTGLSLEKTVARIQQMMDSESMVTHNEKLVDRVGNRRQYDVVIRGRFAGRDVLGVIECKDHKRKKGPDTVEAFAKKTENLNANFRLIVSRRGFTDQALKLAKHEGIGCLSLLPRDPKQVGFGIGDTWYGRLHKWGQGYLTVFFTDKLATLPDHFDSRSIMWSGQLVLEWFEREFFTTYGSLNQTSDWTLAIEFHRATGIEIEREQYDVNGLAFTATRLCQPKKQWVTWSGDAFYDWECGRLTVPPKGRIVGSPIDMTLEEWDDFDGVIPEPGKGNPPGFVRGILDCFALRKVPDRVVNLESIISNRLFFAGSPTTLLDGAKRSPAPN